MTKHFNKKSYTERRRFLRKHLSKAEAVLWKYLSRKQILGYKFRRQYGVDRYVIDFYCPELKLAIEIDGDTHFRGTAQEYDNDREAYIGNYGVTFLRFTNADVYENLHGVRQKIQNEIEVMIGE